MRSVARVAISHKADCWAITLYFMHYNFCRIHQTLRVTPAMEAGIADHVWSIKELVSRMEGTRSVTA